MSPFRLRIEYVPLPISAAVGDDGRVSFPMEWPCDGAAALLGATVVWLNDEPVTQLLWQEPSEPRSTD